MTLDEKLGAWRERVLEAMIGPLGAEWIDERMRARMLAAARVVGAPEVLDELVELLADVVRLDTTRYEHHEPRRWDGLTPREAGRDGTRWLEPNELARAALRRLGRPVPDPIAEMRERKAAEDALWNKSSVEVARHGRWVVYALEGRPRHRVLWEQEKDSLYLVGTLRPAAAAKLASVLHQRLPAFFIESAEEQWLAHDLAHRAQHEDLVDDQVDDQAAEVEP